MCELWVDYLSKIRNVKSCACYLLPIDHFNKIQKANDQIISLPLIDWKHALKISVKLLVLDHVLYIMHVYMKRRRAYPCETTENIE